MIRIPIPFPVRVSGMAPTVFLALFAAASVVSAGQTTAQAADAYAGKALALQWCSSCHLVAEDQSAASSVTLPSFYDIAKDPDWSEAKLATFLANPHPVMPDMSLGNIEIANLAGYISSLKP
ncbi:c-type cytochrome [Roseibium sp. SCP14]|uniref:c-type cytochrome n=1 Tax=Roseibium sp. SCP14 TaxID=3141375 RepID=UPI00333D641B